MIRRKILVLIIATFLFIPLHAQEKSFRLDKPGFRNDRYYREGDPIIFRMKGEKFDRHDEIRTFSDTSLVFYDYEVVLEDLDFIKFERTAGLLSPSNGPKLIIAGIALPIIDMINYSVVQGNEFQVDQGIMITSATLVGVGIFWTSLRFARFKPGKNRKFIISSDEPAGSL